MRIRRYRSIAGIAPVSDLIRRPAAN